MKKWIAVFILFPFFSVAQKKDTVLKYLDQNFEFTTAKKAVYYGVAVRQTDKWFFYSLYPDTTPLIKAYYSDKNMQVKEGPYVFYYPKSKKIKEGYYHNNHMNGIWHFWYENGQMKDSGMISDDVLSGVWKSWHPNGKLMAITTFSDKANFATQAFMTDFRQGENVPIKGLRDGPFESWYANGNKESSGKFSNGQMTSTWHWYYWNGQPATIEVYDKGTLTSLTCFDSTGKETGDFCSISKPAVLKYYGDYKEYIYQNLIWPEEAKRKRIEGNVKVSFQVTQNGELENLVVESPYPVLNKAVQDLFSGMKEWYPEISHNRSISSSHEMVIPFQLNDEE